MGVHPAEPPAPPRVLLLHNRYRATGGEERSVAEIATLLIARGHAVEVLERSSAGISRARAGAAMLRGGEDPDAVATAVRAFRADVVHAHNIHPRLGPRALAAARDAGAAVVLHLHNFRLSCAIGVGYRDGAVCFACRGRNTRPGLRHRCRGGVAESATYAAALAGHRASLLAATDRFVTVSAATRARLETLGLPAGATDVIPGALATGAFAPDSAAGSGRYALFAGRLAEEKGVDLAIAAARAAGVPLRIAGDGPDGPRLRALAMGADVTILGHLDAAALDAERRGAAFALAPSRWEEPCPFAVLEAMAAGLPVLVSDRGGLPELVPERGQPLAVDDLTAWTAAMRGWWEDPSARAAAGKEALAHARTGFTHEAVAPALAATYARALAVRHRTATRDGVPGQRVEVPA